MLEFYFPVYSEIEAQRTLRNVLKDPTFDPTRDADVSRLLSAIKVGAKGRTYGNESEQLEATIRHCVTADDLRSFLISEDEARYRFYTTDDAKKVVGETLPVRKKSDDHRGAVAKRIYAIRNRIVHTKGSFEEREPLLPFDPETRHLRHDIELVEFLARKVLVASSRQKLPDEVTDVPKLLGHRAVLAVAALLALRLLSSARAGSWFQHQ
ncbi:MAG: hypothetical protein M3N33_02285 [Actinomycetota bacterium]|nr:hypothetical protein [Actinomycetota bacterium]